MYGGDFGETAHDSNFCINGLLWPDRGVDLRRLYVDSAALTDTSATNTSTSNSSATSVAVISNATDTSTTTKYGVDIHTAPVLGYGESAMKYVGLGGVRTIAATASLPTTTTATTNTIQQKLLNRKTSNPTLLPPPSPTPPLSQQSTTTILHTAQSILVKPTLLEAKQCMSGFHCRVLSVHNEDGDDEDDSLPALSPTATSPLSTTAQGSGSGVPIRSRKNSRVFSRYQSSNNTNTSSVRRTPPNTTTNTTATTNTSTNLPSPSKLTPTRQHSDERPRSGIQYLANLHEGPRMHDSIVNRNNKTKNSIDSPIQLHHNTTNISNNTNNNTSSSSNSNTNSNSNSSSNYNHHHNSHTSTKDCFFDSPVCTTDEIYIENISDDDISSSNSDIETEFQHMQYDRLNGRAILTVSLEIENRYDHIDDIFEILDFHALLLCDGLIVSEEIVLSSVFRMNDSRGNRSRTRSESFKYITIGTNNNRTQKAQVDFDLNWLNLHSTLHQGGCLSRLFSTHTYSGDNIDSIWDSSGNNSIRGSELHNEAVICGLPWHPSLLHCTNDYDAIHMNVRTIQEYYLQQVRSHSVYDTATTSATTNTSSTAIDHNTVCPGWTILKTGKPQKTQSKLNTTLFPDTNINSTTTTTPLNTSSLHKNNTSSNQWSLVIIGIMNTTTAYAECGYPVGFSTVDITSECNAILSTEIHAAEQSMSRVNSRQGFKSPSPPNITNTTTAGTVGSCADSGSTTLPAVSWVASAEGGCGDVQLTRGE